MYQAAFYTTDNKERVQCNLCSHRCLIRPGKRGICGVRENQQGQLMSLVYGKLVAENIDPVEKKPLYHFLPGSRTYSISTVGCNFQCAHCQNAEISQYPHHHDKAIVGTERTAAEVVESAHARDCQSISYTYVEPTIFYEFTRDCALLAKRRGIYNLYVSNGFMTPDAGDEIANFIDAINIDIKSFRDEFYKKVCKARLQPVLDNVELFYRRGVWLEVTTLLIPGLNDSSQELRELAAFIKNISPDIPWHVSAFRPAYQMTERPATDASILMKAVNIGKEEGLHYIYTGNISGLGADTHCPKCGEKVIYRSNFTIKKDNTSKGECSACRSRIAGIWG